MTTGKIIDLQDALIDQEVVAFYGEAIATCNKILNQAKIYGFSLMHLPDPNIHSIVKLFENIIIPILDGLCKSGDFSPDSGIRIANIKQYTLHLREISLALEQGDKNKFSKAVSELQHEPMLFCS